jgi:hypothetical protein
VALAVAVGEDQSELVPGIDARQYAFDAEDSYLAGVGLALAALAPSGVDEARVVRPLRRAVRSTAAGSTSSCRFALAVM